MIISTAFFPRTISREPYSRSQVETLCVKCGGRLTLIREASLLVRNVHDKKTIFSLLGHEKLHQAVCLLVR